MVRERLQPFALTGDAFPVHNAHKGLGGAAGLGVPGEGGTPGGSKPGKQLIADWLHRASSVPARSGRVLSIIHPAAGLK